VNFRNIIVVLVVPLFLFACASNEKRQPEIKEVFVTDIKENGDKLFSYSLIMSSPQKGMNGGAMGRGMSRGSSGMGGDMQGRKGAGNPGRESMMSRMKAMINEKLEAKLSETGYCRKGYVELDSHVGRGRSQIKGKCKEDATDSDRKMFANTDNI